MLKLKWILDIFLYIRGTCWTGKSTEPMVKTREARLLWILMIYLINGWNKGGKHQIYPRWPGSCIILGHMVNEKWGCFWQMPTKNFYTYYFSRKCIGFVIRHNCSAVRIRIWWLRCTEHCRHQHLNHPLIQLVKWLLQCLYPNLYQIAALKMASRPNPEMKRKIASTRRMNPKFVASPAYSHHKCEAREKAVLPNISQNG